MLGIGKTCVFSSVKARILLNGKPLTNYKVTLKWDWNKEKSDESTTDENGVVTFPAVFESSISRLLPIEVVIAQSLSVVVDGEQNDFWISSKRAPEENAEYSGKNIDITCELTDEKVLVRNFGSKILTACKIIA